MQNSREVVTAAIEFTKPDRLPVIFTLFGVNDTHGVSWNQVVPYADWEDYREKKFDEWGCGWSRTEVENMGQVTEHPLKDWKDLEHYRWPDPDDPGFFKGMEEKFRGSDGKYITTGIFMLLFERMHSLRGFENTLTDLYLERENAEMLADRIVEFDIRMIKNISSRFPGRIHGFTFSDDWGTELALFINPQLWREFFKPRYKKIFDACKEAGWHIWMHSCGKINAILGDLVEIGLNVANLQQPRVLGIEEVGREFAGRLCFQAVCDIQQTLPFKSEEEIRKEAKLLIDCWGTDQGGIILSDYGDTEAIGVKVEKKRAMYEAFLQYDRWRR